MFLNNRHYNPETGTFLSVDPLVSKTGKPYIYGAANPIRFSDPNGLEPCPKSGCVSDNSGGRLPCGRSTYNTSGCRLGNGPKGRSGLPTTVFGSDDPYNRAITESRERKRNHSQDLWKRVDQQGLDFLVGVGGFLPWIGEGIDANDCRNGRASGCVGVIFPLVGGRFLGELFGGASRAGTGAATDVLRYDPDFAVGQIARGGNVRASDLVDFGSSQGWTRTQTATGPIKFVDENGVTRLTIKSGSPRAPGIGSPHIEIRNATGQRIDAYGNPISRRSPGNHTPIIWGLGP